MSQVSCYHFLAKYHGDGKGRVMDCCNGSGRIWFHLRREFVVASYWGMDVKEKRGRLKVDSSRVLAQPGWTEDIIDIDTYGAPWKHFDGVTANAQHACTVFLTIGQISMGTDRRIVEALGLGQLTIPPGIACKLHGLALSYCLTRSPRVRIIEAIEARSRGSARYIGLRLEPIIADASPAPTT